MVRGKLAANTVGYCIFKTYTKIIVTNVMYKKGPEDQ
jgi:hypothetical protein